MCPIRTPEFRSILMALNYHNRGSKIFGRRILREATSSAYHTFCMLVGGYLLACVVSL